MWVVFFIFNIEVKPLRCIWPVATHIISFWSFMAFDLKVQYITLTTSVWTGYCGPESHYREGCLPTQPHAQAHTHRLRTHYKDECKNSQNRHFRHSILTMTGGSAHVIYITVWKMINQFICLEILLGFKLSPSFKCNANVWPCLSTAQTFRPEGIFQRKTNMTGALFAEIQLNFNTMFP